MLYQTDKVSIIVLSREHGEGLRHTLDSIIQQSYRNIEIFLVVERIEDEVYRQLARAYQGKLRFVVQQKGWPRGRVLNNTLKMAVGRYFAIVASGDVWQRKVLEQKVDFLEKNQPAFAVCSDFDVFDQTGIVQESFFNQKNLFPEIENGNTFMIDECCRYLIQSRFRPLSTALIRNESLVMDNPFEEYSYGYDDFNLFLKMGKVSHLGCIKRTLVSKYFDAYKVTYYISENIKNRIAYFENLRGAKNDSFTKYEKDILRQIKNNYINWSDYLLKKKEKFEARAAVSECIHRYGLDPAMGLRLLRSFLVRPEARYDFFQNDRLKKDLLKLYF